MDNETFKINLIDMIYKGITPVNFDRTGICRVKFKTLNMLFAIQCHKNFIQLKTGFFINYFVMYTINKQNIKSYINEMKYYYIKL